MTHPDQVGDLSLFKPVNVLLRAWRVFMVVPIVLILFALAWTWYQGAPYVATSTIVPASARTSGGGIAALAAQFGVGPATAGDAPSLEFYVDLMQSRELLERLATSSYRVPEAVPSGRVEDTFIGWLGVEGDSLRDRLQQAVGILRGIVQPSVNAGSGIVTIRVRSGLPSLAEGVNRRVLELLSEFNLERRQSTARSERRFIEDQLIRTKDSLWAAEEAMRTFLEVNRAYHESPRLSFEASRLERQVAYHQGVYSTLAQARAQAAIDEVRDTPVFTVIDPPEGSAIREVPWLRNIMLAVVLGLLLALGAAFAREYHRVESALHPRDVEEFTRWISSARKELRRLVRRPARPR